MNCEMYLDYLERVCAAGYADEVQWQETLKPCEDAEEFFWEYTWVVVSGGMKNQVARAIMVRIHAAADAGTPLDVAFHHRGKIVAIMRMKEIYRPTFASYRACGDKLTFLERLPWIGPITKYHLAKNLGMDVAKPDRHLVRLAERYNTDPAALCWRISQCVGQRVSTVDLVLWRACNLGMVKF